jgi:CheY-like chemotaxis protein
LENALPTDIFIIDDNQEYLKITTEYIEHHGYTVCSLEDPLNAINCLREKNPNLIILDIMMPGIDGFTLLKQIKEDSVLKNTPVIVVSGKVFPPERKQAIAMGAAAFFTKPILGKDLVAEISKHL